MFIPHVIRVNKRGAKNIYINNVFHLRVHHFFAGFFIAIPQFFLGKRQDKIIKALLSSTFGKTGLFHGRRTVMNVHLSDGN